MSLVISLFDRGESPKTSSIFGNLSLMLDSVLLKYLYFVGYDEGFGCAEKVNNNEI